MYGGPRVTSKDEAGPKATLQYLCQAKGCIREFTPGQGQAYKVYVGPKATLEDLYRTEGYSGGQRWTEAGKREQWATEGDNGEQRGRRNKGSRPTFSSAVSSGIRKIAPPGFAVVDKFMLTRYGVGYLSMRLYVYLLAHPIHSLIVVMRCEA